MDSRLRTGLVIGLITAIPAILLTTVGGCICTPVLTFIGGASAGMIVARDPTLANRSVQAATVAGLAAGIVTGLAQSVGVVLLFRTPDGAVILQQTLATDPSATPQMIWLAVAILSFVTALLDIGIMTGSAVLGVLFAARARAPQPGNVPPGRFSPPPGPYGPNLPYGPPPGMPVPPVAPPPPPAPEPPAPAYPPPPSYYGLPDLPPPPPSNGESD